MHFKRLVRLEGGRLAFECPGCGCLHAVNVDHPVRPRWEWNGSLERPTFAPSLLVRASGRVCHAFVTDGQIRFLNDSAHELAGKTVPLFAHGED